MCIFTLRFKGKVISNNINEIFRIISSLFYRKTLLAQKSTKKHKKAQKSTKKHKKQTSDFHSDVFIRTKSIKSKQATFTLMFFTRIKTIKSTKLQTSKFLLLLRCFYAHKNTVLQTKKDEKHKNANKRIGDFLPLRYFFKCI